MMNRTKATMAAIGPYWFRSAWKLSFFAPHLNFLDSDTRLLLAVEMWSSFSPRLRTSWMFFFMMDWMSCRSEFSLDVFVREDGSTYSLCLRWMYLSNLMN